MGRTDFVIMLAILSNKDNDDDKKEREGRVSSVPFCLAFGMEFRFSLVTQKSGQRRND
jgi:hypothetical protein